MVFKTDEDMSLDKYWEKHCISIAKDRRWAIQKGDQYSFENCATLRQYDDYIKKVASYLDMSISEITPANILHAVSKVAKACQYQEATVKTIISSLRDVFSYAATCGHAYNILSKNRAGEKSNNLTTLMMQRILVPAVANAELSDNCPRALTIGQQGRLALYAAEHVLEDGRFCGILISLYTGMRPAECRGLRWNDFRSFPDHPDHPDRHYLKIDEILNDKLEYSKQVKTKNALRCVPVHIEIEDALQKRREFVQQNMGANKDIGELPIACFGNQFKDPCRGSDYSNFSFKLLKEFGVSSEQLGFFLLDESDNLTPSDSHPPMRILRRNFATVIQACTDMSLEEKEYIFGHRISGKDGAKKRIEYSRNMDRLWRIAQKLDKAPFCKKLYELHFPQIIVGDGIVVQEGRGQGTIRIPWKSAVYGQKLHLHFEYYPNIAELSEDEVAKQAPFGAKWRLLAQVEVRCYILISNISGSVKVAPLQILQFPVILPHKFQDAEKFNLQFSDFSEITETADKLRWLRYQKGLRQRDVADYAGIYRSTYIHYEEYGKDFYSPKHMEKIAQLFEVPVETLLDDYNLFLRNGQGKQIKAIRMKLGLTQREFADRLGISLCNLKQWEQNRKQLFKSTWEKYFK